MARKVSRDYRATDKEMLTQPLQTYEKVCKRDIENLYEDAEALRNKALKLLGNVSGKGKSLMKIAGERIKAEEAKRDKNLKEQEEKVRRFFKK